MLPFRSRNISSLLLGLQHSSSAASAAIVSALIVDASRTAATKANNKKKNNKKSSAPSPSSKKVPSNQQQTPIKRVALSPAGANSVNKKSAVPVEAAATSGKKKQKSTSSGSSPSKDSSQKGTAPPTTTSYGKLIIDPDLEDLVKSTIDNVDTSAAAMKKKQFHPLIPRVDPVPKKSSQKKMAESNTAVTSEDQEQQQEVEKNSSINDNSNAPKEQKIAILGPEDETPDYSFRKRDVMKASPEIDELIKKQEREINANNQQNQKANEPSPLELFKEASQLNFTSSSGNRINWEEIQEKVQYFNIALSSNPSPGVQSEATNQARNLIRGLESKFGFLADDAKVCTAEHDDTLSTSIAIELINAALRFSVPPSSAFISGLCTFLSDLTFRSSQGITSLSSPLSIPYLIQIINGAASVANLRIWDENLFQKHQTALNNNLEKSAGLREIVTMLNGIGSKPLGASRTFLQEHVDGKSSSRSNGNTKSAKEQQQDSTSTSPVTLSASHLIPHFFGTLMKRGDSLIEGTVSAIQKSKEKTTASTNNTTTNSAIEEDDDFNLSSDNNINSSTSKTNSSSSSSPLAASISFSIEQATDIIGKLSDASIANDPLLRSHVGSWIEQLVKSTTEANLLSQLTTAATTLRLDNVFYPALTTYLNTHDNLDARTLSKSLSSVMMLPRESFVEIRITELAASAVHHQQDVQQQQQQSSTKSSVIILDPTDLTKSIKLISVRDIAERAREHLWGVQSEPLPRKINLSYFNEKGKEVKLVSSKPFFDQLPSIKTTICVSEASDHDHKSAVVFDKATTSSNSNNTDEAEVSSSSAIFGPDQLICEIVKKISLNNNNNNNNNSGSSSSSAASIAEWSAVSSNIVSFLAGAVALQIKSHAAVTWLAKFHNDTLLEGDCFGEDEQALLTSEMEFLAIASNFMPSQQVKTLLKRIMFKVADKVNRYRKALQLHSATIGENGVSTLIFSAPSAATQQSKIYDPAIRLSATQLRLLACSTLSVKHDLSPEIASFMLENLFRILPECSLSDISSVLYTIGRIGLRVSDQVHLAIGKRVGTILKFSRATKKFASANVRAGSSLRSGGGSSGSDTNTVSPHDLAVAFSGLHLTKVRWDRMPNLFIELAEGLVSRSKRYTPAQCCQLVAIAKDISRSSQNRGEKMLANEATKLARIFLPQIRQSIPTATDQDLLPLLAWLSTGHIRDVSLLDSILERLIVLDATASVCVSVLDSIHAMGLLGGVSSDVVFRLVYMIDRQNNNANQNKSSNNNKQSDNKITSEVVRPSVSSSQEFSPVSAPDQASTTVQVDRTSNNITSSSSANTNNTPAQLSSPSSSLMTSAEQNAQLAFQVTQLRTRDADLVRKLVTNATEAESIKSLCAAIGALSIIGTGNSKPAKELMRHFTKKLEYTLLKSREWEEELNNSNKVMSSNSDSMDLSMSKFKKKNFSPGMHFTENMDVASTQKRLISELEEQKKKGGSASTSSSTSTKKDKTAASTKIDKNLTEDLALSKTVAGAKNVVVNNETAQAAAAIQLTRSIEEEDKMQIEKRKRQYLYETRDIDIECLMAAMTAIASNDSTPSKERVKFLNELCVHLDRQVSQLPALRSQTLVRQSFDTNNKGSHNNNPTGQTKTGSSSNDQQQQQLDKSRSASITASIAANSTRALPLGSLTKMLAAVAANNLPIFSIFRTCGKCYSAPGALLHMSPSDAVKAISAYAAFAFRDDYVIRSLGLRCYALKNSIAKNPELAEQCAAAMKVFHINFDPRNDGVQGGAFGRARGENAGSRNTGIEKASHRQNQFFVKSQQQHGMGSNSGDSFK